MELGMVIDRLNEEDPARVVAHGFHRPHSYRGYYEQLTFEPAENVSIGSMLRDARFAVGAVFFGQKGGEFEMGENTPCWLARRGEEGVELTAGLLEQMIGNLPGQTQQSIQMTLVEQGLPKDGDEVTLTVDGQAFRGSLRNVQIGEEITGEIVLRRSP